MVSQDKQTVPTQDVFQSSRRLQGYLLLFYTAWTLRVVLLLPIDGRLHPEWIRQCWSQGLRIAFWVVPVLVYLHVVERVPVLPFLKLNALPRGRRAALGAGITAGFLAICIIVAFSFQGAHLDKLRAMTGAKWFTLFVTMSIVATAEEILFRGFVYHSLRANASFGRAGLITSALFVLIHWPGWFFMQGPHWGLAVLSIQIFVIGWVLALLVETTKSLWPAILLHLLNNVVSSALLP